MPPKKEVREIKCQFCGLEFDVKTGDNKCPDCGTILRIDRHFRLEGSDEPEAYTTAIYVMIAISILCFFGIVADALLSDKLEKLIVPVGIVILLPLYFISGLDRYKDFLERVSDARGLRVFSFVIAITLLLILFLILNIMNLVSFDKLQKP